MADAFKEYDKAKAELAKWQAEVERLKNLTPEKRLAEILHEKYCGVNHADGCSWFYEGNDWTRYAHADWLTKATEALRLANGNEELVLAMAKALRGH